MSKIRPYVRFTLFSREHFHRIYVLPLEHRIIYLAEGEADLWVDGILYKLQKNDICYVAAGVPYKMVSSPNSLAYFMYFDLTMENSNRPERVKPPGLEDYEPILRPSGDDCICKYRLVDNEKTVDFCYLKNDIKCVRDIDRIIRFSEECGDEKGNLYQQVLSGMMVILMAHVLEGNNTGVGSRAEGKTVSAVLEYLHQNYHKKITLNDISSQLNFHPAYLNFCVKKVLGMPIHRYLINFRLERATSLLFYTELSVAEVAERVGFSNAKAFSAAFKKYQGTSPSQVKGQRGKINNIQNAKDDLK